jgi:hypothetical protein
MATLRIEIGPLSAEVTTTDATAGQMVEEYLRAYGLWNEEATNAQRLRAFVRHLAGHIRAAGDSVAVQTAIEARREELKTERENLKWGD